MAEQKVIQLTVTGPRTGAKIRQQESESQSLQTAPTSPSAEFASLDALEKIVSVCRNCDLCHSRTNIVFADGNPQAKLMIIGEGPGQREDETGIPFVGRAGQLLDKILASVQIDRQRDTYICNIVKCRPPQNRVPSKKRQLHASSIYWRK